MAKARTLACQPEPECATASAAVTLPVIVPGRPRACGCDSYCSGRKRKALDSSLPISHVVVGGHHDCFLSNQRLGVAQWHGRQTRARYTVRPDHWTATTTALAPSPLAASQRPQAYRIQLSRAKRNLHDAGPRASAIWLAVLSADIYNHFSAVYWRTLFCHWAGPDHFLRD